jgi:AraC family transcriptional regulator
MQPRFEILHKKLLVGKRMSMTISENKTGQLWRSFMPRRKEILNNLTNELFSLQVYNKSMNFSKFDNDCTFEKWAAVEVTDLYSIPQGMEALTLQGGLYAVFHYKGAASGGATIFKYIFETWLPDSGYLTDNRPCFEILGEKYKNEDPDSEEEIWIPVKPDDNSSS